MHSVTVTKQEQREDAGQTYDEAFDLAMAGQTTEAIRCPQRNPLTRELAAEAVAFMLDVKANGEKEEA